ncbi:uncharacterized protein Z519_08520 [Cladophialophora bantiana CBS 173.52]|uniref:Uncharacterized protein n=1 Tax=Cladophialophora bantiana (strain ATCC 10958 / CBS 173.52 / CDC B-1940 / NIH 8579) TaxID=1442370 RepID=A0A0D2FW21_CLAB1|nr:uncharacterized protein Z519_08520 [Cladophialophora bantiana CBS 173.52]KIW90737.1 hypothetical protein Z519_08520 [Cladophialophora bantiana CBS 173.52]
MVILGGLELVAAGYLLKEIHNDSKEEQEREREKRRRRRRHSREDHHRPHRYDDPNPNRPSRPPQQQLHPPQQPGGPPRPYSAPPPQNRPSMMPMAVASAPMWHPPQQHGLPPQQRPPQSYGTWPQGPSSQQQRPSQPQPQWQGSPPQNNTNNSFVPPPLQRPATVYPPPGVHIDLKTGKIQHDMYPPEMPRPGEAREYYEGARKEYDRVRENSAPSQQRPQYQQPHGAENGQHSYSQPQINVTPAHVPTPPPRQGYAELDAETPGRYRPYGNEKTGRGKSNSFSGRYRDDDMDMRDPPPAYRE